MTRSSIHTLAVCPTCSFRCARNALAGSGRTSGTEFAAEDGFDLHADRDRLKLLERTRTTTHLENRGGLTCPACGEPFERLLVSENRTYTFGDPGSPVCLIRTDERLLVLTHGHR